MKNIDSQGFQLGVPGASQKMVHVYKHIQMKWKKKKNNEEPRSFRRTQGSFQ